MIEGFKIYDLTNSKLKWFIFNAGVRPNAKSEFNMNRFLLKGFYD